MTMRANLLTNTKPPRLDNSTTSWASFDDDIDDDSFIEKPTSDRTDDTTKPPSERTTSHSSNSDLNNLLEKLRDPAELERWKTQKEQMAAKAPSMPSLKHEKVSEKASSRNLKTFLLQRSKRGYGEQANLDGLSVVQ